MRWSHAFWLWGIQGLTFGAAVHGDTLIVVLIYFRNVRS